MFVILFRFLLFFIAISVVRSVVGSVVRAFRGEAGPRNPQTAPRNEGSGASGQASASTLLHQDPVCGTYVAAGSSLRKISRGKVIHFCSEACRDRYAD